MHAELRTQLVEAPSTPKKLRALWALHVTGGVTPSLLHAVVERGDEYLRAWAVQLAVPDVLPHQTPHELPAPVAAKLYDLAAHDPSPLVRLYVASALQRIPHAQRWKVAEALVQHSQDADDHNLPLMIWYGVEPLVPSDARRALKLAGISKIPLVSRFIVRRAAAEPASLEQLVAVIPDTSADRQTAILDQMLQAFQGRVEIPMPPSWETTYTHLLNSDDALIRDKADRIAISLGDKRLLPRMREVLSNAQAPLAARQQAIAVIVRGRDQDAAPALIAALDEPQLRGEAIRALAAYDHPATAEEILRRYRSLDEATRRDAISTLTSRPSFALALLNAIEHGGVTRSDVHAYHVRQMQSLDEPRIVERLKDVWGMIRESSADKKQRIEQYKRHLTPDRLAKANLPHGRAVFNKICAACHKLFGEGHVVGPDITGSNRANLDYILENAIDPSSVVSKDYRMSTLVLDDGRVVTGLIQNETDSAYTVRTVNDVMVVAKSDVEQRSLSGLSLMPEGQLDQLTPNEVRDLIAYLASPSQVPLPRIRPTFDASTGKVAGALEGETIKILGKTDGQARSQDMAGFKTDRWSGNSQLWWTGQKVGAELKMEVVVDQRDRYVVEVVLTRARDYGTVQLLLNGTTLGGPIDCYVTGRVGTTGVLRFETALLDAGAHEFSAKVVGKHPQSSNTMFGLDYVRIVPGVRAGGDGPN